MKRIIIILSLLMVICISSCSKESLSRNSNDASSENIAKSTQANNITTKSETSEAVRPEEVGLPTYECKYEKDVWEISKTSQVTLSYDGENIPLGTHVIKRLGNEFPAAPGNFPPSLRLADAHNGDYEVAFSYFVPKSGFLNFVMFDESNITHANDYLGDQYFWYELKGAGYISYKTTFGVDDDSIKDDKQNRVFVENYQTEIWNKCSLKSIGDEIEIYINDNYIATIKSPDEKRRGHLSLDGAEGILFKDFVFEN